MTVMRRSLAPVKGHPRADTQRTSRLDLGLLALRLKAFWAAFKREPLSFWGICAYIFIEYVRPQQIYTSIDVLPFGEVTLALALLGYVFEGMPVRRFNAADVLLGLFTIVLILSSVFAVNPDVAMDGWTVFLNWLILYWLVTNVVTTPRRYIIFWALFLLWSLKMSQHGARIWISRGGSFASWGASGAPGWFQNSGEFAIQMCIFLPMAFHSLMALRERLKTWKFWGLMVLLPGTAVISLLASSSRGGQMALVAVVLFLIAQSRHRVRGLITAAVVLALLWSFMPPEQRARFETMGDEDDDTSQTRLTYWEDGIEIAKQYPLFGIGYENWLSYYRLNYDAVGELPHNIFIEAWAELGYTGLLAFLGLIGGTFYVNFRTRRKAASLPEWGPFLRAAALGLDAALVGYMAAGFFVTVLFYPFFWVNLAFTAALHEVARRRYGTLARSRSRVRRGRGAVIPTPVSVASFGPVPSREGGGWPNR